MKQNIVITSLALIFAGELVSSASADRREYEDDKSRKLEEVEGKRGGYQEDDRSRKLELLEEVEGEHGVGRGRGRGRGRGNRLGAPTDGRGLGRGHGITKTFGF